MLMDLNNKKDNPLGKLGYRVDIQGLRAIAVLAVVIFHAKLPLPGGFVGVDIFFVISGFVITRMLAKEWISSGKINLASFYWRRFKRLTPALVLVVIVTIVLSLLILSPLGQNVRVSVLTGYRAVFLSANIFIAQNTGGYFDTAADTNPLINTWSLSVEEQFYLVFPFLLALAFWASRKYDHRLTPLLAIAVVIALSLAAMFMGWSGFLSKAGSVSSFYNPIPRAWEFGVGAVLALINLDSIIKKSRVTDLLSCIGFFLLGLSFFAIKGSAYYPNVEAFAPVVGTMMLIIAGGHEGSLAHRVLSHKWLTRIGDISYSLYLWHWPFIVFTSIAISQEAFYLALAAVISAMPATLSYVYVEQKIRHWDTKSIGGRGAVVAIAAILPALVALTAVYVNKQAYWSEKVAIFKAYFEPDHLALASGCGLGRVPSDIGSCAWNTDARGKQIYAIGDSNIDQFSEALLVASSNLNAPLQIFSKGGCSFLGRSWSDRRDQDETECLKYVDGSIRYLEQAAPGIVLLGISEWGYKGLSVGSTKESASSDPSVIDKYLEQDLLDKVMKIREKGHKVVLLLPIPKFYSPNLKVLFDPQRCATLTIINGKCPSQVTLSVEQADAYQEKARRAIKSVALLAHVGTIDFRDQICPQGICSNYLGPIPIYRDAGHLNVVGSRLFWKKFSDAIKLL